jgi:hypothetical protein
MGYTKHQQTRRGEMNRQYKEYMLYGMYTCVYSRYAGYAAQEIVNTGYTVLGIQ